MAAEEAASGEDEAVEDVADEIFFVDDMIALIEAEASAAKKGLCQMP